MLLSVSNISVSLEGENIIRNISFTLDKRERLAVTGVNGAGKTTLLRVIAGELRADSGEAVLEKGVRIAYLPQEAAIDSERTLYEEARAARGYLFEMEEELAKLEERISRDSDPRLMARYSSLTHIYETSGGYQAQSEVKGVLRGLGFKEDEFGRKVMTLSGGEKTRLMLSLTLLSGADLIILDEPTNHLDIEAVSWLEGYLKGLKAALIVATHDRYFLDRVAGRILDIEGGLGTLYGGGYSAFSEKKAALRRSQIKAYLLNEARIRHEEEVIAKLKSFNREKSVRRADSREKALNKIERVKRPFVIDESMRLKFTPLRPSGRDVLFADHIGFGYPGGGTLINDADLSVRRGERIALIGPNGAGKTSFLKILSGLMKPDAGEVIEGAGVRIGYYDQELMGLDPEKTVFMEISDHFPDMSNTEIRTFLAGFLFKGDRVFKKVSELSGGEKGRLSLAKLMLSGANLLLLDEPTNHLDIPSREVLEEALLSYEGTLITVSHDRYFIDRVATRIIELNEGRLRSFDGDYGSYLSGKAEAPEAAGSRTPSAGAGSFEAQRELKRERQRVKSRVKKLEEAISAAESRIREIDSEMALPEVSVDAERLLELSEARDELQKELEESYFEWDALSEEET